MMMMMMMMMMMIIIIIIPVVKISPIGGTSRAGNVIHFVT